MQSLTVELLHPYQSTRDLDGILVDRETVQDIAYDGEVAFRCQRNHVGVTPKRILGILRKGGNATNTGGNR